MKNGTILNVFGESVIFEKNHLWRLKNYSEANKNKYPELLSHKICKWLIDNGYFQYGYAFLHYRT